MKGPTPGVRKLLFGAFAGASTLYLLWRAAFTMNSEHPLYASVFLLAEAYAVTAAMIFYILVLARADRPCPVPQEGLRVDVVIATYNEEIDLIRRTAVAARDMGYPHRTWICDDGRRPQVKELAGELGVGYVTRPWNEHYKSGNLNNALACTDGDLVVVLDADHVVRRQFLTRTLGHFRDPSVALVQTPQVYYNVDSYQHALSTRRRRLWHEASIFHHAMQPGADRLNSAFFVGTGAILRRSALEAVGGFATETITEDIHTSMRLHAAGFRSVYVDEALGFLLAPDTPFAYTLQRLRWAQGAMQILRKENPLRRRGLSIAQRLFYLNSLTGYLGAYQHTLFYLAPGLLLIGNLSPIALDRSYAFWIFAGRILLDLGVFLLLAGRHARLLLSECFKILNVAIFLRASLALLRPDGLPFRVTPKGKHGGLPVALLVPSILVFLFNLTAIGAGVTKLSSGTPHPGAVVLSTFFATLFAVSGALALLHAVERRGTEEPFAFPVALRSSLRGPEGRAEAVTIVRLNATTAYVTCRSAPAAGTRLSLDLSGAGLSDPVTVAVAGAQPDPTGKWETILKLTLLHVEGTKRDVLDRFLFNTAVPDLFGQLDGTPTGPPPDFPPEASRHVDEPIESFVHLKAGIV
jgi:cellulose synthase (UDP-forming)